MEFLYIFSSIIAVALFVYLAIVLIKPDLF